MTGVPRRQLFLASALLTFFAMASFCIKKLTSLPTSHEPGILLAHVCLALHGLFLPLVLSWAAFRWVGLNVMLTSALGLIIFVCFTASTTIFIWNAVFLLSATWLVVHLAHSFEQESAILDSDTEKIQDQLNDLQVSYKVRGEGISVFFEKYSTYYNLRKLAEDLARMLSMEEVTKTLVGQAFRFIPRGNFCSITLAQREGGRLPVIAKKFSGAQEGFVAQEGNGYDMWVVKNRKRLIVNDSQSDFRFASQSQSNSEGLRSLILTPLMNEGRVMGTLGLFSRHSNVYTHDDLRLLDAIATLASSAISNSVLYERTNELAIRDSLTGLYVRRYFYSRLNEEHRRALITQKPVSVLMCDLDFFKALNDQYGHQAGDLILIQLTEVLRKQTEDAVLARYGGEEFAIILPEIPQSQAIEQAELIRKAVEQAVFKLRRQEVRMTVSIGVASFPLDALEVEGLVGKADAALYDAKKSGRNRVCHAQS